MAALDPAPKPPIGASATKQLAEFYGCSEKSIKDNYQNNADRFVDGVHCFKLEGDDLGRFKDGLAENIGHPLKFASVLMIWTEKGSARHAKMLRTCCQIIISLAWCDVE